jgi:hypothetical protein
MSYSMKNMYRIGNSIVLPHVRFVKHGEKNGRPLMLMFHSAIIRAHGHHKTLGCNKMDDSGFCLGHEMSEKDFIEQFCAGAEIDAP